MRTARAVVGVLLYVCFLYFVVLLFMGGIVYASRGHWEGAAMFLASLGLCLPPVADVMKRLLP